MDNIYLISFGMGLALLGFWRVGWSARELACSRPQGLRTRQPRKPMAANAEPAIEQSVSRERESQI